MRSSLVIFALLFPATICAAPQSAKPAFSAQPPIATKISVSGVHNAGKISNSLYRGTQPDIAQLSELKKLGVTTVVDLRAESPQTADLEQSKLKALGIDFVHLPIGGFSTPTDSELITFFRLVRASPSQTLFVHCEFGRDRTGVMIASYRIAFEHWTSDQALTEMMAFGFNRPWHPGMVAFVRNLPTRINSEPELKKALGPPESSILERLGITSTP